MIFDDIAKNVCIIAAELYSAYNVIAIHSNDSHQCPILSADFVILYYGIENDQAIQAWAGSE